MKSEMIVVYMTYLYDLDAAIGKRYKRFTS